VLSPIIVAGENYLFTSKNKKTEANYDFCPYEYDIDLLRPLDL
jgi:hypothetical protein